MLTGFKGVKYGLSVPKKEAKPAPRKTLAAFAEDDSDDDQQKIAKDIERQAKRKQTDKKVAKMQEAALAEDPSIFDYDSHFDGIQEQREGPKAAERQARKSRYIEGLLDKAKERQKEQDIVYERRLIKEREAEDHLFGDKERFVTAAYKQKLEEDKKWLEEEALREQVEAQQDVRKRGHMGDFYRNLLTKNVAFGSGEARAQKPPAASESAGGKGGTTEAKAFGGKEWEELRRAREAYEARTGASNPSVPDPTAANPTAAAASSRGDAEGAGATVAETLKPQVTAEQDAAPTEEVLKEEIPIISREDKAAAARERFLARKRKAPA